MKWYKQAGLAMKTTAYVLDSRTNTYLVDNNNHVTVNIREALELRDNPTRYRDPEYKYRRYMTRNPNPDKRVELIPRNGKSPHFAFAKSSTTIVDRTYDETYSHEIAVDVLSAMKEMTIITEGKTFNFKFSHVYREPKLTLPNGKVFYPDIFCVFDKEKHPDEYARWGGKLVIEVTNTHKCEDDKKLEFELCNIPIFEFTITDSRKYPPERDSSRIDSLIERSKHKERLESWLQDSIYTELIIDPISTQKHELILKELKFEVKELIETHKHHELLVNVIESKLKLSEQFEVSLLKGSQKINEKSDHLQCEITNLKSVLEKQKLTILNYKSSVDILKNSMDKKIFKFKALVFTLTFGLFASNYNNIVILINLVKRMTSI